MTMITDSSKRVIPFRPNDTKRVGQDCFYLDDITWLNGANIELGDRVKFNSGCWVNGYGGLSSKMTPTSDRTPSFIPRTTSPATTTPQLRSRAGIRSRSASVEMPGSVWGASFCPE